MTTFTLTHQDTGETKTATEADVKYFGTASEEFKGYVWPKEIYPHLSEYERDVWRSGFRGYVRYKGLGVDLSGSKMQSEIPQGTEGIIEGKS